MTTWSLTPFFNEVDLLEIRLAELDDVVDIHVIAEATVSYSGKRKPLYFAEHRERFAPWKDKIRYIVVDDMPDGHRTIAPRQLLRAAPDDNWRRENHQRNNLNRGLEGMEADDKVLISDLDEILRADVVREMKVRSPVLDRFGRIGRIRPAVTLHLYWLNWAWSRLHESPIASFVDGATVLTKGVQKARMLPSLEFKLDKASGWHFSYMGGLEAIQTKLSQAAHQEVNKPVYNRRAWIEHCVTTGKDLFRRRGSLHSVPIEDLPGYVGANLDRFSHMIGPELPRAAERIGLVP